MHCELDCNACADASNNGLPSIPSAASQVQSFLAGGANSSFAPSQTNSTGEAKAIGNLVANSIKLGSDLAPFFVLIRNICISHTRFNLCLYNT